MISRTLESVKGLFIIQKEEPDKRPELESALQSESPAVPTKVVAEAPAHVDAPDEVLYILSDNGKTLPEKLKLVEGVHKAPYSGRLYYYKSKSDPFTVFDFRGPQAEPLAGAHSGPSN